MSCSLSDRTSLLLRGSALAAFSLAALAPAYAASPDSLIPDATSTEGASADAADAADAGESEEIVVTARHREEDVQDVPVAVSVVSSEHLERTGNFSLNQVQQQVPSLQVVSFNPRNSNINIRGLGANASFAVDGLEYGVGFYLDGVYYGRPGQSQFDLVDLQQIEVLHGPQGTLFGKNTTSGAINISSRAPSFTPELTAEASVGNVGYHQVRVSASGPLVEDKVALRLTLADTHRDGFLTNLYDNSKAQDYDNFSARAQLLIQPWDGLKVRLIGDYSKQRQHYHLNVIDGTFTTYANGATIPNNIIARAARFNYTLPTTNAFSRIGNSDSHYQSNMESYGLSGQADYDFGPATLTAITAYRWWDWYPANDLDGLPISVGTKAQQVNFQRQFSQELRVASNGKHFLDWQAGLYYFWQVVRGYGQTQYGSDFAAYNLNPATIPAATIATTALALTNFEADSYSDPRTKSYAAFGQIDAHLSDALTLTAGLRYTHEDKSGSFRRYQIATSGLDLSGLNAATLSAITAIRNAPAYQLNNISFATRDKDNSLGGLVTLSYKPGRDALIYTTYSRGSKSGGLNVTAGGLGHALIEPEKVDNFELGVKTQWFDRALTVNAAAFLTNVKQYQANITEPIPGATVFTQYISNIPKVRSKGLETDLVYAPSKWVNLNASFAYTDAKYVRYTNAPNAPERLNISAVQDLSGVALPGVSKFAYTLGVDLTQPIQDGVEVYGHSDWLHRSSFNSTPTNSAYGKVPAYGILNAKLGLRVASGKYDFAFWARNLLNKQYYSTRSPGTFGLITAIPGDPRTIGATLRVKL